MKRGNVVGSIICFLVLMGFSLIPIGIGAWAGEEELTPTAKSSAQANPALLQNAVEKQARAAGDTVTVSLDSNDFPTITMSITVQNAEGGSIHGLTLNDLLVTEQSNLEGAPTTETILSFEELFEDDGASIAFVFDISDSMSIPPWLDAAKEAAMCLLNVMNANDRAMLMSFFGPDSAVEILPPGPVAADTNANGEYDIAEAIRALNASGATAIYDAMAEAIPAMQAEDQPKAILLFTDGFTNSDETHDINDVIQMATAAGIPVHVLNFGRLGQNVLDLANGTGGMAVNDPTCADMNDIYSAIAGDIASTYSITYETHNPSEDGTTRTVETAYDGTTGTATYTVSGSPNQAPTADAGEAQTVNEGTQVVLDASGSSADTVTYLWEQTGGPTAVLSNATAAAPSFTAPLVGAAGAVLIFQVTVSDEQGAEASATTRVTVQDIAAAADFTWTPTAPVRTETVQFSDRSTTGGAPIVAYAWDFGDGQTSADQNPSHVFSCVGDHQVALTVTDAQGTTNSRVITIGVANNEDCDAGDGCFIMATAGSGKNKGWAMITALLLVFAGFASIRKRVAMKRNITIVLAIFVLVMMGMTPDAAQAGLRKGAVTVSGMGGIYYFDDEQEIEKGPLVGLGLEYQWAENWGVELMLTHGWHDFHYLACACNTDDVSANAGKVDLIYYLWPEKTLVPYLAAGIGGMSLDFDRFGNEDDAFANYGGGVKYFLADDIALRADVRGIYTLDDSYNNLSAMVGVSFLFGGEKKVEAPVETVVVRPAAPTEQAKVEVKKVAPAKPAPFDILFEFDRSVVNPALHDNLKQVADYLRANDRVTLRIEGHADEFGSRSYNNALSKRRAFNVGNYLANQFGISRSRMQFVGFGKSRPVATNATEEGRSRNRRVELKYIETAK